MARNLPRKWMSNDSSKTARKEGNLRVARKGHDSIHLNITRRHICWARGVTALRQFTSAARSNITADRCVLAVIEAWQKLMLGLMKICQLALLYIDRWGANRRSGAFGGDAVMKIKVYSYWPGWWYCQLWSLRRSARRVYWSLAERQRFKIDLVRLELVRWLFDQCSQALYNISYMALKDMLKKSDKDSRELLVSLDGTEVDSLIGWD